MFLSRLIVRAKAFRLVRGEPVQADRDMYDELERRLLSGDTPLFSDRFMR
jgi:hypothetical protein